MDGLRYYLYSLQRMELLDIGTRNHYENTP